MCGCSLCAGAVVLNLLKIIQSNHQGAQITLLYVKTTPCTTHWPFFPDIFFSFLFPFFLFFAYCVGSGEADGATATRAAGNSGCRAAPGTWLAPRAPRCPAAGATVFFLSFFSFFLSFSLFFSLFFLFSYTNADSAALGISHQYLHDASRDYCVLLFAIACSRRSIALCRTGEERSKRGGEREGERERERAGVLACRFAARSSLADRADVEEKKRRGDRWQAPRCRYLPAH